MMSFIFQSIIFGKEFYSPGVDWATLQQHHLGGLKVSKPDFKSYRVFIRSTGSGTRHLAAGGMLLYEV